MKTAIHAKELDKRVKILSKTTVRDQFGGSTASYAELTTRWAKIEELSTGATAQRTVNIGLTDFTETIKVTIRYDINLDISANNNLLEYAGKRYTILNITKVGFTKVQNVIIARAETTTL